MALKLGQVGKYNLRLDLSLEALSGKNVMIDFSPKICQMDRFVEVSGNNFVLVKREVLIGNFNKTTCKCSLKDNLAVIMNDDIWH